jgi:hypothetical protein
MAATWEAALVAVTPASSGPPTYTELCGFQWKSLTLLEELAGPGMCTLGVEVDTIEAVGKTRLLNLAITPAELWIRRTTGPTATSIVFAGPITSCHIVDRNATITAPGLLAYLGYWLRDSDFTASNVDQATIVQQLVDQWQAQAYGNDGIVTTALTPTGVLRTLNLLGVDGKYIDAVVTTMGQRDNGFDLTINPTTRQLLMWSPRKGNDLTASVFLDRRSIASPDVSWTVAPGQVGSEVFASSSSDTGVTLTSIKSNPTLRATFGRAYVSRQYDDISVQATLDDYATRTITDVGAQHFTVAPKLIPVTGFGYGDFATGDLVTYDYDAGLGQQTFPIRVASIETTLDDGRELLTVGVL